MSWYARRASAWRPVAASLRRHGHDVYPISLTGLGERAHLARPDTDEAAIAMFRMHT